jgi:hypothetical protein
VQQERLALRSRQRIHQKQQAGSLFADSAARSGCTVAEAGKSRASTSP